MFKKKRYIVILILVLFGFITLLNSFTAVPTGHVGIKTKFGKVQNDVIQEGLNFKVPFIEKIVLMDCKTKKIELATEGSTKDMQTVSVTIAVNYNVNKSAANTLYRDVGVDYEAIFKITK